VEKAVFELNYTVGSAEPVLFAAAPVMAFQLQISAADQSQQIHNVLLQCQLQIEATRRRYSPQEQRRLVDLFGDPERWSQTLRSMLWTHASVTVPPFRGETVVELHVPCTFDFNVAATKYFYGLHEGDVPLSLLFSGTIFYEGDDGALRVTRISWDKEARYRLPWKSWKALMEHYYPHTAWLCLPRGAFERLYRYKLQHGILSWEKTIESLVNEDGQRTAQQTLSAPAEHVKQSAESAVAESSQEKAVL
jgi:hypothetical protein